VERHDGGERGWRDGVDVVSAALQFATRAPDGIRLLQRGKIGPQGPEPITAIRGCSRRSIATRRAEITVADDRRYSVVSARAC
jgi:hypothetical protein